MEVRIFPNLQGAGNNPLLFIEMRNIALQGALAELDAKRKMFRRSDSLDRQWVGPTNDATDRLKSATKGRTYMVSRNGMDDAKEHYAR